MLRADEETLQRVRVVLADAMEKGVDAAEALDRAGLVMHLALAESIRVDTVNHVAQVLDMVTVEQVAQMVKERMPTSMLDAKRQLVAWLRGTVK